MKVCSLFSGIGGFELGFDSVGADIVMMCENDKLARTVLKARFPNVKLTSDVRKLKSLPNCDILTAGWPCQDLSQAGRTVGIAGERSGLVSEVFRLLDVKKRKPEFVLLENVAFALQLERGAAIELVSRQFNRLGYKWAYRVLDSRSFGLPQRRRRIFILASLSSDPASILFDGVYDGTTLLQENASKFGFYWTEGNTGLGWSVDSVPPLKGGSSVSIPSPPAIWDMKRGEFSRPGIADAERMQGFPAHWTDIPEHIAARARWKLVGNAVSVPVVRWIAERIKSHSVLSDIADLRTDKRAHHNAASGGPGLPATQYRFPSEGPANAKLGRLSDFASLDGDLLSLRAARGFLSRIERSSLRTHPEFIPQLREYVAAA